MILRRVLRGDDHKWLVQRVGLVCPRLGFAHRFQQTALRFRRRAVDFIQPARCEQAGGRG